MLTSEKGQLLGHSGVPEDVVDVEAAVAVGYLSHCV